MCRVEGLVRVDMLLSTMCIQCLVKVDKVEEAGSGSNHDCDLKAYFYKISPSAVVLVLIISVAACFRWPTM